METGLEGGPIPIRIAAEIYFCVFAVRLDDGPHSLMRKEEDHTKGQTEQPKSEINRRAPRIVLNGQGVRLRYFFKALEGDAVAGNQRQISGRGGQSVWLVRRDAMRGRRLRNGDFAFAVE